MLTPNITLLCLASTYSAGGTMNDTVYPELARLLDTIPNGFPPTESGIEIRLLQKIFTPDEARLTLNLKLNYETPDMIAGRVDMEREKLEKTLFAMRDRGLIFGIHIGETALFKLMPYVFGIYEMQLNRMDLEFIEMAESYWKEAFGEKFYGAGPSILKVLPVEKEVPSGTEITPYESLSAIIDGAKAWAVGDCICKKEKAMRGHRCDRPMEVCMALAPIENYFDGFFWGRPITREEAFRVLETAEKAGLVHMVNNVREGQYFVCNCCECCCGMLRGISEFGFDDSVGRSRFIAVLDEDLCTACGACLDRCQVKAIDLEDSAKVNRRCIGCGLCVSSCPSGALRMAERKAGEIEYVPKNEKEWFELREKNRGGNFDYVRLMK